MRLYTRAGDTGETSLGDGSRVPKDHLRVSAYGELDELNALLGLARASDLPGLLGVRLAMVQDELFAMGAELAMPEAGALPPGVPRIGETHCQRLEGWIDESCAGVEPLRNFILPAGVEGACRLHVARTCCRRAERDVVALAHAAPVRREIIVYLNRLSDLLFAWAREVNHHAGQPDVTWKPDR